MMGPRISEYRCLLAERDEAALLLAEDFSEVSDAASNACDDLRQMASAHPLISVAAVAGSTYLIARLLNKSLMISLATLALGMIRAEATTAIGTRYGD